MAETIGIGVIIFVACGGSFALGALWASRYNHENSEWGKYERKRLSRENYS
jgi:hypothetical protein